ncbi:MAG: TIGR04086 family membrane protein [Acidimicrobiales bacterium]|nr:TIGR04086 family membrane protein [Acidimicrobiales bacterium]
MRRDFLFFGQRINRNSWLTGAFFSLSVVLIVGLVIGSFVDENSEHSLLITAALSVGLILGGFIAAWRAPRAHIAHGMLTASPALMFAVVAQCIRLARGVRSVTWLSVIFICLLAVSLATLGGVLGGRWAPRRGSLFE